MASRAHGASTRSTVRSPLAVVARRPARRAHRSDEFCDGSDVGALPRPAGRSRCSRPATCSAPAVRSCSCATRDAASGSRGSVFPRWLRTKWIGIALFVAVLFSYELFDLWALPRATAYLVLAYFAPRSSSIPGVLRRQLLQVPLSDRPVQFRGVDDVAARAARQGDRTRATPAARWTASKACGRRGARVVLSARLRAAAVPAA